MSEEEKKAIENLKKNRGVSFKEADVLSNLLEKQQKEINKAIEYIENAKKELYGCGNYYLSDLLNILKGELNVE